MAQNALTATLCHMKPSDTLSETSTPKPIAFRDVGGFSFVELTPTNRPKLDPDELQTKLAAFYEKYPRRGLRKGEKGVVESVREIRDRR